MTQAGSIDPEADLAALVRALDGRAAGLWRIEADRLMQVAFVPADDLPAEVAREFAEATRSVPLSATNLGIVQAAVEGSVTVSRSADLPGDSGSGRWLRAFGAERSVAVPLADPDGRTRAVLSVALAEGPLDDRAVADLLRSSGLTC